MALREQINLKRNEYADLEEVLAREREVIARLQAELSQRDEEVIGLQRKAVRTETYGLDNLQSRYNDLQQKYKETREELWAAKMEEMHNRDELSSTKQKLQKFEEVNNLHLLGVVGLMSAASLRFR
jgi:chromosome segregation ATPase